MNLLVTGAAGFIGSCYVRTLLAADGPPAPRITVLDKLTYAGNLDNLDLTHPGWSSSRATSATPNWSAS